MKLNVDLTSLQNAVKKMGAPLIDFDTTTVFDHVDIDSILNTTSGIEIDINEIEVNLDAGGLFEYKGRQVLLFIPNHNPMYKSINDVLNDPMQGNRFHVSDCTTLKKMRETNRYNKYHVTQNLSGMFEIYNDGNEDIKKDAKLHVCKNCLMMLNYKNYKNETNIEKNKIFNNFKINEFFETYSAFFEYLPNIKNNNKILDRSITPSINRKNYICKVCNTDFKNNPKLLVSEETNNNICLDCYRKQKEHKTAFITNPELKEIYKERTIQNKVTINSWDDVYKYVDISIHGYIHRLKRSYRTPTHIGYIPSEISSIVLDIVWITETKKSALVTRKTDEYKKLKNWNILTLGEAMERL